MNSYKYIFAFCNQAIRKGCPLMITEGNNIKDYIVEMYQENIGNKCIGVSTQEVLEDIPITSFCYDQHRVGDRIKVALAGDVLIPRDSFINPSKIAPFRYIKPIDNGMWKVQKRRTKKSKGYILAFNDTDIKISLEV